jgi:hypothetical protein
VDQAVASGGSYEVLAKRLDGQGQALEALVRQLNEERLEEFGRSQMEVIGRMRVRTENNCLGRDIAQVGGYLLFGYNVFMGLKQSTRVEDVFGLYRLHEASRATRSPRGPQGQFLGIQSFVQDFQELYAYYKNTRLMQLAVRHGKLLASFQIGERLSDVRVFRWSVPVDGQPIRYIDNRGERDIDCPRPMTSNGSARARAAGAGAPPAHQHPGQGLRRDPGRHADHQGREQHQRRPGHLQRAGAGEEPVAGRRRVRVRRRRQPDPAEDPALPRRAVALPDLQHRVAPGGAHGRHRRGLHPAAAGPRHHLPGGYYLQSGEHRSFEQNMQGMRYRRSIRSPNGEDVLYVFYEPRSGRMALFKYNLIERALQPPLIGHGYARMDDGRIVIFAAESNEASRVHPMQVWRTPFASDDYAARQPQRDSFWAASAMPSWSAASRTCTACARKSRPPRSRCRATSA